MATSTPQQTAPKPLLTKKEAAAFYAVSERTIDRWLTEGVLPEAARVIIGNSPRFRTSVLMAHIAPPSDSDGGAS